MAFERFMFWLVNELLCLMSKHWKNGVVQCLLPRQLMEQTITKSCSNGSRSILEAAQSFTHVFHCCVLKVNETLMGSSQLISPHVRDLLCCLCKVFVHSFQYL